MTEAPVSRDPLVEKMRDDIGPFDQVGLETFLGYKLVPVGPLPEVQVLP
jgi:hypothetical protein